MEKHEVEQSILNQAPADATHYDTGEGCYLKAANGILWYKFPLIHQAWRRSRHKDGVAALDKYDYHVSLEDMKARLEAEPNKQLTGE